MKLVTVVENFDDRYGGPAFSIPGLLNALTNKYDIESLILSVNLYGDEINSSINLSRSTWINDFTLTGPKKIMYAHGLKRYLENYVDSNTIVYINNLWNYISYIAFSTAKKKNAKIIIAPRGSLYPWSLSQRALVKRIALSLYQKRHLNSCDILHVTSQDEEKYLLEIGVNNKSSNIPHGISLYENGQVNRAYKRFRLSKNNRYFLFMSRLHKKKGIDDLIEIWKLIHDKYPLWKLLFAGTDYDKYESIIKEKIGDSSEYLGMVSGDEKADLLSVSEFFVLPTYAENFGMSIGEALGAGVPVITTKNAPWDIINTYECGVSVYFNDFRKALEVFLTKEKEELAAMGAKGKNLIIQNYSWEKAATEFHNKILAGFASN